MVFLSLIFDPIISCKQIKTTTNFHHANLKWKLSILECTPGYWKSWTLCLSVSCNSPCLVVFLLSCLLKPIAAAYLFMLSSWRQAYLSANDSEANRWHWHTCITKNRHLSQIQFLNAFCAGGPPKHLKIHGKLASSLLQKALVLIWAAWRALPP